MEKSVEIDEKYMNSKNIIKENLSINISEPETVKDKKTELEDNNIEIKNTFDYLISTGEKSVSFDFVVKSNDNENIYKEVGEYKYAICILLKDNSLGNCELLKNTIQEILNNLEELKTFDIGSKDIYIFIFINKIIEDNLVKKSWLKNITKAKNYLKTSVKLKGLFDDIKIDIICKKEYMTDIESLQCFYNYCVGNIKKEDKYIITSVITAGIILAKDCIKKLIQLSFIPNATKKFAIVVPSLEVSDNINFFIKIAQYDRIHFNIYTMNFYYETCAVPVSSLLNLMIIDKSLMITLIEYYKIIEKNATIDYHDYDLALFLYRNLFRINYYSNETLGSIQYNNFNYMEYSNIWVNKFSGYYGNIFNILKTFTFCNDFSSKIFMFFQIIGLLVEFIYPSLSVLVIYSIFYEAFGIYDNYPAVFMTLLYLIIYLGSGACSMITNNYEKMELTNYFFYIFMEVYYLFILVCSIPAMDNIKKNKGINILLSSDDLYYKFNKAACACLIVFTFIVAILPTIFKCNIIFKNIGQMFIYLVLGAPSSTSNFLIAKIWRAPETMGGEFSEERKGITIIFFFLFNFFFGFLSFYNYDRRLRANCVMILAIMYLVYLFFKIIAIIIPLLCGPQLNINNDNIIKKIILEKEDNTLYNTKEQIVKSTDELKGNNIIEEEKLDVDEKDKNNQFGNQNQNKENYEININNNRDNYQNYPNGGFNENNQNGGYNENNNNGEEFVIEQNEEINKEGN